MNYRVVTVGEDIYHHGIKGQKWGVRRFQNKDGTLTAAGRRRLYDREKEEVSTDEGGYISKRKMTKAEMDSIDTFNDAREKFLRQEISRKEFEKARRKLLDKDTTFDNSGVDLEAEASGPAELRLKAIMVTGKQEVDRTSQQVQRILSKSQTKALNKTVRDQRIKRGETVAGLILGGSLAGLTWSYLKDLGMV